MTDVDPLGTTWRASPATRKPLRSGVGFLFPGEGSRDTHAVSVAGLTTVAGIPAMPDVLPETHDDAPVQRQIGALLSELTALQRVLVGHGDPGAVLSNLEEMAQTVSNTGSPRLTALLAAVRLRARVELVRR